MATGSHELTEVLFVTPVSGPSLNPGKSYPRRTRLNSGKKQAWDHLSPTFSVPILKCCLLTSPLSCSLSTLDLHSGTSPIRLPRQIYVTHALYTCIYRYIYICLYISIHTNLEMLSLQHLITGTEDGDIKKQQRIRSQKKRPRAHDSVPTHRQTFE